jgi:hypothetical protein
MNEEVEVDDEADTATAAHAAAAHGSARDRQPKRYVLKKRTAGQGQGSTRKSAERKNPLTKADFEAKMGKP